MTYIYGGKSDIRIARGSNYIGWLDDGTEIDS